MSSDERARVVTEALAKLKETPLPATIHTLSTLEAATSQLSDGAFHPTEVIVGGLRIAHKQRLGKGLVFLKLRAPNGCTLEGIVRRDVLLFPSNPDLALHRLFALGDVVSVAGMIERSKGRLSIHARRVEVQEAWDTLFPQAMFRDDHQHVITEQQQLQPRQQHDGARNDTANGVLASTSDLQSLWAAIPSTADGSSGATVQCNDVGATCDGGRLLLVQVVHSHAARLHEYLHACHGVETLATVAPMSGPHCPRDERCLLLRTSTPAELLTAVLLDGAMSRFIQRWYVIDELASTLQEASEAVVRCIQRRQQGSPSSVVGGGTSSIAVRVQAFPKPLEPRLVELLRTTGFIEPEPHASLTACVSFVFGALAVGIADGEGEFKSAVDAARSAGVRGGGSRDQRPGRTNGGQAMPPSRLSNQPPVRQSDAVAARSSSAAATSVASSTTASSASASLQSVPHSGDAQTGGQVCRAFFKLREVSSRLGVKLDVGHAIDVGASPGGWTTMLCQAGCRAVTAVDPGNLYLPPDVESSGKVEHLQMRIEEAIPILQSRGKGAFLDMLVCDMNAPPADVITIVTHALPLLSPGATLVLTFKNSFPKKSDWLVNLDAALVSMRGFAKDVSVVHLLANTAKETTVVGTVLPPDARSGAAVLAAQAATAEEAAAARRVLKEQRERAASDSCASSLVAKPKSKAERAAMAEVHARCASAWARAREIATGL